MSIKGVAFNLLDTPGHQDSAHWDFSEGTYRTLTAVAMLLDAAPNFEGAIAARDR